MANQLASPTERACLGFEEGEAGTMGCLDRMGSFDHLDEQIEITPKRLTYFMAELHRGGNAALVEIARINKDARDDGLPNQLT